MSNIPSRPLFEEQTKHYIYLWLVSHRIEFDKETYDDKDVLVKFANESYDRLYGEIK